MEIAYFGLLPEFVGKRLGGALLTAAIARAWDMRATRVWVHTCDFDHPSALPNCQAGGLRVFHVEQKMEELPDRPLEPWPGAHRPLRLRSGALKEGTIWKSPNRVCCGLDVHKRTVVACLQFSGPNGNAPRRSARSGPRRATS